MNEMGITFQRFVKISFECVARSSLAATSATQYGQRCSSELTVNGNEIFEITLRKAMKRIVTGSITAIFLACAAVAVPVSGIHAEEKKMTTTASGLKYTDDVVGTGTEAVKGKKATVHYTGWLDKSGQKGSKFDSSRDRGEPFDFMLGEGQVIAGWDEGVQGMKIGGKRVLHIPSKLGYGASGAGAVIPPNADLIFEVELLKVG